MLSLSASLLIKSTSVLKFELVASGSLPLATVLVIWSAQTWSSFLNTALVGQFTHGPLSVRQMFQRDGALAHNGEVRQTMKDVFPVTATTRA